MDTTELTHDAPNTTTTTPVASRMLHAHSLLGSLLVHAGGIDPAWVGLADIHRRGQQVRLSGFSLPTAVEFAAMFDLGEPTLTEQAAHTIHTWEAPYAGHDVVLNAVTSPDTHRFEMGEPSRILAAHTILGALLIHAAATDPAWEALTEIQSGGTVLLTGHSIPVAAALATVLDLGQPTRIERQGYTSHTWAGPYAGHDIRVAALTTHTPTN